MDERLRLEALIAEHLTDSRKGLNKQFSLADPLRQSVYSRLAGDEDLNDAALAADPTFRLIGSPKICDRSVDAYGADAAWELDGPCDEEIWTCGE